jgi:hypothetical protein
MKALRETVITTTAAFLASTLLASFAFSAPTLIEDDAEEKAEEEEKDEYLAIIGGDIYTGTGAILRGATLLAKNGVIEEIGYDLWLPEDTEKLDARGLRVYPGLVALNATTRISRGLFAAELLAGEKEFDPGLGTGDIRTPPTSEMDDDEEQPNDSWGRIFNDPSYAELPAAADQARSKVEDAFDPYSQYLVLALATGITTAEQSNAAIKLRRGEFEGTFMAEKAMAAVSWSKRSPSTIASTRAKFATAAKYLREYRAWQALGDKEVKEPSKKGVDTNVLRILKGEALARFNSHERENLLGIARLAQTYGFRPVIVGCREGWTVADELGRAGAYAIITPRDRRPKPESLRREGGSSIENAAILHRSGVQVAVVPANTSFDLGGITGRDLMHLPIEAGFAVRGGMSNEAALQAITLIPARLLGVAHRVGTLEVGKDCDAVVTDGDILHYQTFVQYAVVLGEVEYDKQEELFYAHIRPRQELPPLDPGEDPPTATSEEPKEDAETVEDEVSEEPEEEGDETPPEDDEDEGKEEPEEDGEES